MSDVQRMAISFESFEHPVALHIRFVLGDERAFQIWKASIEQFHWPYQCGIKNLFNIAEPECTYLHAASGNARHTDFLQIDHRLWIAQCKHREKYWR